MENIPNRIREQKTSLTDWSVTSTVVTTMRRIVGSIINNQASGGKWLLSEAILDTVRVYIYCYVGEVNEVMKVELYRMVEEQDGLGEEINLSRNLEKTHMKIRGNMKSKLEKYLEPLLHVPSSEKYHRWFSLILYARYVN